MSSNFQTTTYFLTSNSFTMRKKDRKFFNRLWLIWLITMCFGFYAQAQVHMIPNTSADTLEHFIENTDYWNPGDTIMLSSTGVYIVNGTVDIYQEVTIMGPGLDNDPPVVQFIDNGFRPKEDSISITIKGFRMNGYNDDSTHRAPYVLRFDQAAFYNYNTIVIEDVDAWGFVGGLQLYKYKWSTYDEVIINNVIWHDFSGQYAIDPFLNAVKKMSVTNSTFYDIETGFIKNFYFSDGVRDTIPQNIMIDHNTLYNVAGGGNNALVQINDPNDSSIIFNFTNNVVSKLFWPEYARPFRINVDAGYFTFSNCVFNNFLATDEAKKMYNLDTIALYDNVMVTNIDTMYPGFADTTMADGYDLTLPVYSLVNGMGTDGGTIGDPRWLPDFPTVHEIPNTAADTLEHFIEETAYWNAGDVIKLVSTGDYVVNGTVDLYQEVTIMGPGLDNNPPTVQFLDNGFRAKEDSINITIKGFKMNGFNDDSTHRAGYILRFDQAAFKNYKTITVEDCEAWGFQGGLQLYKYKWTVYEKVIVNNVIWHDFSGQYAVDPFLNAVKYLAITNSTFYELETGFLKNPYYNDGSRTDIPQEILIDHNTFWKVTGGGNNAFLQINDPNDGSVDLTFTNNIVSTLYWPEFARPFRINEQAGPFTITNSVFHNFLATDPAKLKFNLDTVADYSNVTVSDILTDWPGYKDTTNGDFLIHYESPLMTAGTDGGRIGDPRWMPYGGAIGEGVHPIPNDSPDTLEHFIENTLFWKPGDTIMLSSSGTYIVNGTVDIYQEITIMADPLLTIPPTVQFLDNGFRAKEDSINITIKGFNMNGFNDDSTHRAPYILRFDQAAFKNYKTITIQDVEAWGFVGGLQLYKYKWTVYENVIIDNVTWHDISGQYAIDPFLNAVKHLSVTNSTFYEIETGFMKNPYFSDGSRDTIPQEIIVDHNTFWKVAGGGNNAMVQMNDPADSSVTFTFTNNVVSTLFWPEFARPFRLNVSAGEFLFSHSTFHNFEASDINKWKYNLDSVALYSNVTVSDIYEDDPVFRDTLMGDFMLPLSSSLLLAGTDGMAIGDPDWVPEVGITIKELTETILEGDSVQMEVDAIFAEGVDTTATWSVINQYGGSDGWAHIVDTTGKLYADTAGQVQVVAVSNHSPVYTDTLLVTIETKIYVTEITLSAKDALGNESTEITNKAGFLTITASILPGGAHDQSITWSTSGDGMATIDVKSAKVCDLVAVKSGTVTVRATANDGSGVYGELVITISGQTPVESVTVTSTGDVTTIDTKGGTLQMIATVLPDTADIDSVAWSVNDENIATIDAAGLLTAVGNGTVTVTARATDGSYKSGTMDITITNQNDGIFDISTGLRIIPNPAADYIYVKMNSAQKVRVEITNLVGAVVKSIFVDANSPISIQDLDAGIYLIKVETGKHIRTERLIVQ